MQQANSQTPDVVNENSWQTSVLEVGSKVYLTDVTKTCRPLFDPVSQAGYECSQLVFVWYHFSKGFICSAAASPFPKLDPLRNYITKWVSYFLLSNHVCRKLLVSC